MTLTARQYIFFWPLRPTRASDMKQKTFFGLKAVPLKFGKEFFQTPTQIIGFLRPPYMFFETSYTIFKTPYKFFPHQQFLME